MESSSAPTGVGVLGWGKYVPKKLVPNSVVEHDTGLAAGTIETKTGVKQRFVAEAGETCSGMSYEASLQALTSANVSPEQIGLVLACTFTAEDRKSVV